MFLRIPAAACRNPFCMNTASDLEEKGLASIGQRSTVRLNVDADKTIQPGKP
jgi:hypothetical protein